MKRSLFSLFTLLLVLVMAVSAVSADHADRTSYETSLAQRVCGTAGGPACTPTPPPPRDLDGDGVPDVSDGCPRVPGPASNGGCPENTRVPPPSDRDGDGTPDDVDRCPDVGGHAANGGCPLEGEAPPVEVPADTATDIPTAIPLPNLPTTGECMVATLTADRVNVRGEPSLDAAIVGALDPTLLYAVIAILETGDSSTWVRVTQGWVASWVVRMGGACDTLPAVDTVGGNDSIWIDIGSPIGRGMDIAAIDGEIVPGSEEVSCSNNLHPAVRRGAWILDMSRDPAMGDGQIELLSYSFGSSDTGPEPHLTQDEWCVQEYLNPKGFMIISAGGDAPEGANPPGLDELGLVINWFGGEVLGDGSVVPTETLVIAHVGLKPSASNPPEPDMPGMLLVWHIPHDPAYEGTHALYQDIFIPTSETSGLVIDWQAPPEPDAPANGTSNWIIINSNGPVDGQPPEPDAQGIIIDWHLPFDPAAQGIIIDYSIAVDPETSGILIDWAMSELEQQPGPPTDPADTGAQGIIIEWSMSELESQPGPPTDPADTGAQGFVVNWFPNGMGGGENGIIIIDTAGSEQSGTPRISIQLQRLSNP